METGQKDGPQSLSAFRLATTSLEGGVKLWDTNTGDALRTWGGSSVRQACFSADGCSLLIAGNDSTAKILNTLTGAAKTWSMALIIQSLFSIQLYI